jgi:hypothetical protein
MYWRRGTGFLALWISSLTLAMSALAAIAKAGSSGAALAFLAVAAVLAPPSQEAIARLMHVLAPARVAWFATIVLVPIGLGILGIDWVARLEAEARNRGFASAAQWGRAQDLGLGTPQALARHDEARSAAALAIRCREAGERRPLACYEAAHQRAALMFTEARLAGDEVEAVTRAALGQLRKDWLAVDRDCTGLLDRIEEDALPEILQSRARVVTTAAGLWARQLSRAELEVLAARAKAGTSYMGTVADQQLDQKLARVAPAVERELDGALQDWARLIVATEPGWRMMLRGRSPPRACRPAQQGGSG